MTMISLGIPPETSEILPIVSIRDFHNGYRSGLAGPPKRLTEWLKAAEEDIFLEDHEDDDKPRG
jgi:hypothetical protein